MFANLLAATLASSRGLEGCTRIDCDIFVGAKCARGSRTCRVLVETCVGAERGSTPASGWIGLGEVGIEVCDVPPSGPWETEDEDEEGPATKGSDDVGGGFTNMD